MPVWRSSASRPATSIVAAIVFVRRSHNQDSPNRLSTHAQALAIDKDDDIAWCELEDTVHQRTNDGAIQRGPMPTEQEDVAALRGAT